MFHVVLLKLGDAKPAQKYLKKLDNPLLYSNFPKKSSAKFKKVSWISSYLYLTFENKGLFLLDG